MSPKRFIPSLDGLRAISVIFVIFGHTYFRSAGRIESLFLYPIRDGYLGVATFFVISGYLITTILLKELNSKETIRLGNFYLRRAFRIFPPFYVYLGVLGILALNRVVDIDRASFLVAATYTWNYSLVGKGHLLGHLWSLCLEEQFYLIWPAILLLLGKRKSLWVAVASVILSPISRIATYYLMPAWRGHTAMMLHTRIDTIMIGCILALVLDMKLWTRCLKAINRTEIALAASIFVIFINTPLLQRYGGAYTLIFGITLQGICCGIVVLYTTHHPDNLVGRFLNNKIVKHIGIISYSLYLWQQLFTADEKFSHFPWNMILIFACAELSFFLVERPSFALRDRLLASNKSSNTKLQNA